MMDMSRLKKQELALLLILLGLLLGIYVWIYLVMPFAGTGNSLTLNVIYLVFSIYPVVMLWRILRFYDRQDLPRRIWLDFFIGFGLFFLGDASWAIWNILWGEVPTPSLADIFFISAYIFLAAGLFRQYRLIFSSGAKNIAISSMATFFVAIFIALVVTFLRSGLLDVGEFIEYLYPALDLLLAMVAFYLLRTFGSGSLARPFWGFIILAFADVIYAILVQSGYYSFLINDFNFYSLFADLAYTIAYIVFTIGFWEHLATLKYDSQPAG